MIARSCVLEIEKKAKHATSTLNFRKFPTDAKLISKAAESLGKAAATLTDYLK